MCPILVERPICTCPACDRDMFEGDELFDIEGEEVCEDCADEWFEEFKRTNKRELRW